MHPFQVMSEPIRRRIVTILASGSHTSGEVAAAVMHEFGVTRRAVSWHLAILSANGFVRVRIDSTTHHYILDPTALDHLREEVHQLEELWRRRIGWMAPNDPLPEHALPIEPLPPSEPLVRLAPGKAKGMRGRGRRRGVWQRSRWSRAAWPRE